MGDIPVIIIDSSQSMNPYAKDIVKFIQKSQLLKPHVFLSVGHECFVRVKVPPSPSPSPSNIEPAGFILTHNHGQNASLDAVDEARLSDVKKRTIERYALARKFVENKRSLKK